MNQCNRTSAIRQFTRFWGRRLGSGFGFRSALPRERSLDTSQQSSPQKVVDTTRKQCLHAAWIIFEYPLRTVMSDELPFKNSTLSGGIPTPRRLTGEQLFILVHAIQWQYVEKKSGPLIRMRTFSHTHVASWLTTIDISLFLYMIDWLIDNDTSSHYNTKQQYEMNEFLKLKISTLSLSLTHKTMIDNDWLIQVHTTTTIDDFTFFTFFKEFSLLSLSHKKLIIHI